MCHLLVCLNGKDIDKRKTMGNQVSGDGTEESNWTLLHEIKNEPMSWKAQRRERLMRGGSERCNEHTAVERQPCASASELDKQVAKYLDQLTHGMTPAGNYCARRTENLHYTRQRMLNQFGECIQTNYFNFEIQRGSIDNWLRLYAAAIRCSVERCQRGFVFLDWECDETPEEEGWGHATTLYFDTASKLQVFVDPSNMLRRTEIGDILEYLEHHHVWLPPSERPILRVNTRYEASRAVPRGYGGQRDETGRLRPPIVFLLSGNRPGRML
jgi:hypothetical protein